MDVSVFEFLELGVLVFQFLGPAMLVMCVLVAALPSGQRSTKNYF
jgi:hypothetical protein